MRIFLLTMLAVMVGAGTAPPAMAGTGAQDFTEGFAGIAWGANIHDLSGMRIVEAAKDGSVAAEREGEDLTLDQAQLESIRYHFRDDRLHQVTVALAGDDNLVLARRALTDRHGDPRLNDTVRGRYIWTLGKALSVSLYCTKGSSRGLMTFRWGHSKPYTGED